MFYRVESAAIDRRRRTTDGRCVAGGAKRFCSRAAAAAAGDANEAGVIAGVSHQIDLQSADSLEWEDSE